MKPIVVKKNFDILTKRPGRLLSKEFYLRVIRVIQSSIAFQKLKPSDRPRLYFDVTVLSVVDNKTGVQRVIRSVFQEIKPLIKDRYEIIPVACTAVTKGFLVLHEINLDERRAFKPTKYKISPKHGDVFLSLEQAFVEHLAQEETFREMRETGCRIILTVYDLLPIQLPHCFPHEVKDIFEKWLLFASNFAEFLSDSKTVQADLIYYLASKNIKVDDSYWFYPGSDFVQKISTSGQTPEQSLYLRNLKNFKYNFLMVGTIEPRKGHKIILDLFTQLWGLEENNISLTFIGKEGWMVGELIKSINNSKYFNKTLFWFNNASDSFLDLCYKETDAVIVASLNEGFGLPIIEAAQRNCRIIANDIPVFREVSPEGCFFLNLTNPIVALKQLKDWLKEPPKACLCPKTKSWKETAIQIARNTHLI